MFLCLQLTGAADHVASPQTVLLEVAQQFSPRVARAGDGVLFLDLEGLERLFGDPRTIAEALRRALADRGLRVHLAVAGTRMAARLLASARAGISVVAAGEEASALAALPIGTLTALETDPASPLAALLPTLRRWGLRTLGDLAGLPPADLASRAGAQGVALQAAARGKDDGPLVPQRDGERFEATVALEWPVEGLEPLSFVIGRLADEVSAHLDRRGRAATVLAVDLRLVTREVWARRLNLPAPMKDARTLRTLALLDLESHPPPAAIDAVTLRAEPTPARSLQHSLLERARPRPEQVATLMARVGALLGHDRAGTAALLDTDRPGAFRMAPFTGAERRPLTDAPARAGLLETPPADLERSGSALRRLRRPVAAMVASELGRPVHVRLARAGLAGGRVTGCAGPWRTSGDWWAASAWDHDEWDVALEDGALCRLFRDRRQDRWYLEALYD